MLTHKIPDSTLMLVHAKTTVQESWEAIVKEYTDKGAYAQTEKGKYSKDYELSEKNYLKLVFQLLIRTTFRSSLLYALSNFGSSQLTAARMFSASKTINLILMSLSLKSAVWEGWGKKQGG